MNDLDPIKICVGGWKVDQISPRGKIHVFVFVYITGWVGLLGLHRWRINNTWVCF